MGIKANHLYKEIGDPPTRILTDINLEIRDREFVSLTGRSGSGKSSLLYLLSSLDNPSGGSVEISGQDIAKMKPEDLYHFRNAYMGFVFQFHYLIAELSAIENVLMPTYKLEQSVKRRAYAESLLEECGLKEKMKRRPRELSGGEQQRVAIARALVMEPRYIFADEPTGSLDSVNGDTVMQLLIKANQDTKTTIVLVTHEPDFAKLGQRQIHLADGRIVSAS